MGVLHLVHWWGTLTGCSTPGSLVRYFDWVFYTWFIGEVL